jgi:hypothetical protein
MLTTAFTPDLEWFIWQIGSLKMACSLAEADRPKRFDQWTQPNWWPER